MSISLDAASSEYFEVDATPIVTVPMTYSAWMYPLETTSFKTAIYIGDKDSAQAWFVLYMDSSAHVVAGARINGDGTNLATAVTTATYNANAWNHVAARFITSTDRDVFVHGGNRVQNTVSMAPAGMDRISIGRHGDSTPGTYMNGRLGEIGVWNVALTENEIFLLSRGVSPLRIQPQNLVLYFPLLKNTSPTPNYAVGGGTYNCTVSGTVDATDHPPVMPAFGFDPARSYVVAAAPSGSAFPYHYYQQMHR